MKMQSAVNEAYIDPVMTELWAAKDSLSKQYGSLQAFCAALQPQKRKIPTLARGKNSGRQVPPRVKRIVTQA